MTQADPGLHGPHERHFVDEDNWAHYLDAGERLLGTWRPDDTFRPYGTGKTIMALSAVASTALLVATLLFADPSRTSEAVRVAAAVLVLGTILGLGPAKLDQLNRRARRYAVSDKRALEFQDIRRGRLRSVTFGENARVLRLYNEGLESHELSFVNLDEDGKAAGSVLFERLTGEQADSVLRTLRREGLVGQGHAHFSDAGLHVRRSKRTRI